MSSSQFGRGRRPRTLVESASPQRVAAASSAHATRPAARAMYHGKVPLMTRSPLRDGRRRPRRGGKRIGEVRIDAGRRDDPIGRGRSRVRRRRSPRGDRTASGVPCRSTALASTSAIHAWPATTVTNVRSLVGRSAGGRVDEVMTELAADAPRRRSVVEVATAPRVEADARDRAVATGVIDGDGPRAARRARRRRHARHRRG